MAITFGNGNISLGDNIKAITDVAGRTIKSNIQFDGNGVRISGREHFLRKIQNRAPKGQLADLYRNKKKTTSLVFPRDLDDEHYIIINALKRNNQTIKDSKGKKEYLTSFVLPIPGNLQVQYQAQYENQSLGAIGAAAAGRLGGNTAGRGVKDIIGKISSKVSSFGLDSQTAGQVGAIGAAITGVAAGAKLAGGVGAILGAGGIDNVFAGVMLEQGLAINPHMAVIFKGVDFRSHVFEYKFIARNQAESDTLKAMISAFSHHMLPGNALGSRNGSVGLAFDYPDEFELSFAPGISSYLYRIGTCVLTQMSVNYNGESIPTFFEQTGAPVSINMTLSFQEVQILTKDGFNNPGETDVNWELQSKVAVAKADNAAMTLSNGASGTGFRGNTPQ